MFRPRISSRNSSGLRPAVALFGAHSNGSLRQTGGTSQFVTIVPERANHALFQLGCRRGPPDRGGLEQQGQHLLIHDHAFLLPEPSSRYAPSHCSHRGRGSGANVRVSAVILERQCLALQRDQSRSGASMRGPRARLPRPTLSRTIVARKAGLVTLPRSVAWPVLPTAGHQQGIRQRLPIHVCHDYGGQAPKLQLLVICICLAFYRF